ncbi:hypothetical protein OH77DRAFT_1189053 [Trametes cingulata]|nr:hypothetical protein OH77DRAFT_1189053 [Trametes cingulata]
MVSPNGNAADLNVAIAECKYRGALLPAAYIRARPKGVLPCHSCFTPRLALGGSRLAPARVSAALGRYSACLGRHISAPHPCSPARLLENVGLAQQGSSPSTERNQRPRHPVRPRRLPPPDQVRVPEELALRSRTTQ